MIGDSNDDVLCFASLSFPVFCHQNTVRALSPYINKYSVFWGIYLADEVGKTYNLIDWRILFEGINWSWRNFVKHHITQIPSLNFIYGKPGAFLICVAARVVFFLKIRAYVWGCYNLCAHPLSLLTRAAHPLLKNVCCLVLTSDTKIVYAVFLHTFGTTSTAST